MLSEINKIINQVKSFESKDLKDIEAFRLKILGKKGHIADFFSKFKNVKNSEKKNSRSTNQFAKNIESREN